jgi:hypothetical protein
MTATRMHGRGDAVSRERIAPFCACDISARQFVAVPQQLEVERKRGFFAGVIAAHKAAGFVPKRSLGEMYAAKNCNGTNQKLLPVVGRIGYVRH